MDALLLVNLQVDYMPGGALPVPHGDEIIPIANRLMRTFETVAAARDWLPLSHRRFAANHQGYRPGDLDKSGTRVLWPVHCVAESEGAHFHPQLDVQRISLVVDQGSDPAIDTYSAFFDEDYRRPTPLGEFLSTRGVESLFVMGVPTEGAIRHTVIDALKMSFKVTVVEDACRAWNRKEDDVKNAIEEMKRRGGRFQTSAEILATRREITDAPPGAADS